MSYRKVKTGNARKAKSSYNKAASSAQGKQRKSGRGKSVLTVLAAMVIIAITVNTILGLIYSPTRDQCKEIVSDFQTACNELDTNGMINCLKPSVANPLRIALGIGSVVTERSSDEMLESILGALGGGLNQLTNDSGLTIQSMFETIEIRPRKFGFPKKTRKVKCKATFCGLKQDIYISVTKESGEVYITKVAFKG